MTRTIFAVVGVVTLMLVGTGVAWAGDRVPSPAPMSVKSQPVFRQNGAFGSPGGFPFPSRDRRDDARDVARHHFFPRFPSTVFLFTPSALYTPPVDPAPPVVSVSPVISVAPTVYVAPPPAAAPPIAAVTAAAPVPATPSVVEYPTGRYELRGDGVGTPYVWVWVPNPPSAPPAAAASREEPPAGTTLPPPRTEVYRWTDDEGTTFWTNRREQVPERYRSRVPTSVAAQQ